MGRNAERLFERPRKMVPAQLHHARKLLQRDILVKVFFDEVRDLFLLPTGQPTANAKTLLEERTRSVTQVGLMLGFTETSSFTTSFRRTVGVTPSDFRRSIL
jgi:AraC-like DNA-binding protein